MSSSPNDAEGKHPVIGWTQDEIDAHEARGGAWGSITGNGRPIPGIDYGNLPPHMWPLKTSRDWNLSVPPEDDEDE